MDNIQYMLKPDWVTLADIKDCLIKAHEVNRKKGIVMQNQFMSVEELGDYLKDAFCFVAVEDKRVIGTASLKYIELNKWWAKGLAAYTFMDAILPEYRGTDVFFNLNNLRNKYVSDSGVKILFFDTAENNKLVQKLNIRQGARRVQFFASKKTWYYSVMMAYWLDGECPYSERYCNVMFSIYKFLVKLIWKPGHKFRFWLS